MDPEKYKTSMTLDWGIQGENYRQNNFQKILIFEAFPGVFLRFCFIHFAKYSTCSVVPIIRCVVVGYIWAATYFAFGISGLWKGGFGLCPAKGKERVRALASVTLYQNMLHKCVDCFGTCEDFSRHPKLRNPFEKEPEQSNEGLTNMEPSWTMMSRYPGKQTLNLKSFYVEQ